MFDLIYTLLLAMPVVLAIILGKWFSRHVFKWVGLIALTGASMYPLANWYVLRFLREAFFDLNFKSEVVAASVTGALMLAEIPLCLTVYMVVRWVQRRKTNPINVS